LSVFLPESDFFIPKTKFSHKILILPAKNSGFDFGGSQKVALVRVMGI
jgi:hypothetical protein